MEKCYVIRIRRKFSYYWCSVIISLNSLYSILDMIFEDFERSPSSTDIIKRRKITINWPTEKCLLGFLLLFLVVANRFFLKVCHWVLFKILLYWKKFLCSYILAIWFWIHFKWVGLALAKVKGHLREGNVLCMLSFKYLQLQNALFSPVYK